MTEYRNSIEDGVRKLMSEDDRCREDDKWLIWKYVRNIDGIDLFIPFEDFDKMTSFESITRIRRRIQNDDNELLPLSEDVRKQRGISEEEWREWAKNKYKGDKDGY